MANPSEPLQILATLPKLTPRQPDSHKGTFGKILVIAGSRGMSGAAILCGSAALRGGAGLVRLAVPEGILPIVAAGNPCYTTIALPQDSHGRIALDANRMLAESLKDNDVVAIGPGLGQSPELVELIGSMLKQAAIPVVVDADGLNNLAQHPERLSAHTGPLIVTPHPGEFARLLRRDTATVEAHRQELAVAFARQHRLIVILKGHATLVTDGERLYENTTGNPGMATGGTGDVLTGLIAALLGQQLEPFAAAQLGVYLHGLAGDLAAADLGQVSLITSDLVQYLPKAFQKL
jgi:ADP-dependent NAD(P)H-hydrate dehydratase